jgi:hypothetical protein
MNLSLARTEQTAIPAAKNGAVIGMSGIRKVYDTGKIRVEALKGLDLRSASASSSRSSDHRDPGSPR